MPLASEQDGEIVGSVDRFQVSEASPDNQTIIIEVVGWILHTGQSIKDLYFESPEANRIRYTQETRIDLIEHFPSIQRAEHSGYRLLIEYQKNKIPSTLKLRACATLESGSLVETSFEIELESVTGPYRAQAKQPLLNPQSLALSVFLQSSTRMSFAYEFPPLLSIVIVSFNNAAALLSCLRSLQSQCFGKVELIIVDNNSEDDTRVLLNKIDGAKIILNDFNEHFVLGTLRGAESIRGAYLLLLNQDTEVLPGGLSAVIDSFRDHPQLGVLGARLIHHDGRLQEVGSMLFNDGSAMGIGVGEHPHGVPFLTQRSVDFVSGAFLATPTHLWKRLGGFDKQFAPAYYEDVDYCLRAKQLGLEVLVEPRITVIHHEGATHQNQVIARELQLTNREKLKIKHAQYLATCSDSISRTIHGRPPKTADSKRVLLIDDFFPCETTGQGTPRSQLMVRQLQSLGYRITCIATNEPTINPSEILETDIEYRSVGRGDPFLEFLALRAGSFGLIIISRPHNFEEFIKIQKQYSVCAENCRLIYDAEAIFALREIRQRQYQDQHYFSATDIERIVSIEILSVRDADHVFVASEEERFEFEKRGINSASVVSYGTAIAPRSRIFEQRSGVLFVGPLTTPDSPNTHGFSWFISEAVPLFTQKELTIHHVGLVSDSAMIRPLAPTVVFHGVQKNLADFYDSARVFIAPIHYGAGIPIKVIEAAAHGIPVVATPYIADRLGWSHEAELLIGRSAEEFASHIERLMKDEALWNLIRRNALERSSKEFSHSQFAQALAISLKALAE
jgi:GT2 family glycosyltransferase